MEIQALRLRLIDDDIQRLIAAQAEDDLPVRDLRARLTEDGITVSGRYPTVMLAVPFEMLWRLEVTDGKIRARLVSLDFSGVPAGPFRGLILGLVREELESLPGVSQDDTTVTLDLAVLLSSYGPAVQVRAHSVRHEAGALVVECVS